jgi:NAD kinase
MGMIEAKVDVDVDSNTSTPILKIRKSRTSQFMVKNKSQTPRVMMFIKPWDETVFKNFFIFLATINDLMKEFGQKLDLYVANELYAEYEKSSALKSMHGLTDFGLKGVGPLSEEFRNTIDLIITLGGDGTILWASKQFSGDHVPKMITFD